MIIMRSLYASIAAHNNLDLECETKTDNITMSEAVQIW